MDHCCEPEKGSNRNGRTAGRVVIVKLVSHNFEGEKNRMENRYKGEE
jgi:hypothetical protein